VIPIFHIFGSEELSNHAHGISQLVPHPYVAIHSADASSLGIKADEEIRATIGSSSFELRVVLRDDLTRGTIGLPVGLIPIEGFPAPTFATLAPAKVESTAGGAA
jgi:NADH-quinone oxidoreductase subunit G